MKVRQSPVVAWWWGESASVLSAAARLPLIPLALAYSAIARVRTWMWTRGPLRGRRVRLAHPVISVGNVTVGGTGKTPTVRWICEVLQRAGRAPWVLSSGWGTRGPGCDLDEEGESLRRVIPGLRITQSRRLRRRLRRGDDAIVSAPPNTVFVLDDGLQKVWLARDLDIVVVDASRPFGSGWCIPAGPMREPPSALGRGHVVILSRVDQADPQSLSRLRSLMGDLCPRADVLRQCHRPDRLVISGRGPETLAGKRVHLLSAIGNPAAFERTVAALGAEVVGAFTAGDHAPLDASRVDAARRAAVAEAADVVLATGKDAPKVAAFAAGRPPLDALEIRVEFEDDPAPLVERIASLRRG